MILVFTTGESIGPTGERSPVVTLLKNALVEESGGPFGCSRTTRFLVLILGVIVAVSCGLATSLSRLVASPSFM